VAATATSGGGLWALARIAKEEDIGMKKNPKTEKHKVGTGEEWLGARLKLLKAEKEHTRRGDELALMRQELPWVRVDKDYRFVTDEGKASLSDLFRGRSQILIYHLMFGPDYTAACPSCSAIADGFNGFQIHLANHDLMLWAVSRAPLAKLQGYKRRMGWTFPWASSFGSDFNLDYSVGFSPDAEPRPAFISALCDVLGDCGSIGRSINRKTRTVSGYTFGVYAFTARHAVRPVYHRCPSWSGGNGCSLPRA
jgi:peroxiredoxin